MYSLGGEPLATSIFKMLMTLMKHHLYKDLSEYQSVIWRSLVVSMLLF